MSTDTHMSPAVQVMNEAIELAIEECSPYPDRVMFIDADAPDMGKQIKRALDEDMAIVLVFPDCSTRTLYAELAAH
jgi:2-phospho-L-lactate guanylyltransferase (CobY/MobA/RfbA family)